MFAIHYLSQIYHSHWHCVLIQCSLLSIIGLIVQSWFTPPPPNNPFCCTYVRGVLHDKNQDVITPWGSEWIPGIHKPWPVSNVFDPQPMTALITLFTSTTVEFHAVRSLTLKSLADDATRQNRPTTINHTLNSTRRPVELSCVAILQLHVKMCLLGASWEISSSHLLFWDTFHISETNQARKLKFGAPVGICR